MYSRKISPYRLRRPCFVDRLHLSEGIVANRKLTSDKIVSRMVDVEATVDRILDGSVDSYVLDDQYLVCYEVGAPWYSNQKLLGELLILRLEAGSAKLADVVLLLEDLMHEEDAVGIVVGGAFARHPRALARMYKQLGFVEEDSPTLVKWRQHG